jgi:hypothetical protein
VPLEGSHLQAGPAPLAAHDIKVSGFEPDDWMTGCLPGLSCLGIILLILVIPSETSRVVLALVLGFRVVEPTQHPGPELACFRNYRKQVGGMKSFCLRFRGGTVTENGTDDQLVTSVEGGHWIYAFNRGSSVEFIDHQQSKTPDSPIPTSQPSCLGQKASGSDTTMLILAFSPG